MAKSDHKDDTGPSPTSISPTTTVVASPTTEDKKSETVYIEWEDGDPRYPLNWSQSASRPCMAEENDF